MHRALAALMPACLCVISTGAEIEACSQALDVTIAERRPLDALQLLKSTEKSLLPAMKSGWVPAEASAGMYVSGYIKAVFLLITARAM